jgi:hypothetical protein
MRAAMRPVPPNRFPIPLALPCEIALALFEMLPPESVVSVVCCCWYMYGLYCEDGTFASDQLWAAMLQRTFPSRLTGAPGPNVPPRLLKLSPRLTVCRLAADWMAYVTEIRAVRAANSSFPTCDLHASRRPCILRLPSPPARRPASAPSRVAESDT